MTPVAFLETLFRRFCILPNSEDASFLPFHYGYYIEASVENYADAGDAEVNGGSVWARDGNLHSTIDVLRLTLA